MQVLGFGRTERSTLGEELFSARLWSVACDRGTWFHCTCGVASGKDKAGVCVGDSGGPVLYRGTQVSGYGPRGRLRAPHAAPSDLYQAPFQSHHHRQPVVNATMDGLEPPPTTAFLRPFKCLRSIERGVFSHCGGGMAFLGGPFHAVGLAPSDVGALTPPCRRTCSVIVYCDPERPTGGRTPRSVGLSGSSSSLP